MDSSSPKIKILIVDDEEEIREFLTTFLKEQGYETLAAKEGIEALEKIQKENPNLILLDLNIPNLSGFEILDKIKRKEIKIPVLIFSGIASANDRQRIMALGASGYLNKPIQLDILLEEIKRLTV